MIRQLARQFEKLPGNARKVSLKEDQYLRIDWEKFRDSHIESDTRMILKLSEYDAYIANMKVFHK